MRFRLFFLFSAVVFLGSIQAGQVDWSSSAFSEHQQSDGTPLDDTFLFELGAFANGFVPTAENTTEWAQHWKVAQRAPFNPANQIVAGSYVVETNAAPFGTNQQGYIWGLSSAHTHEWFLITSSVWKWPSEGGVYPPVPWTVQNSVLTIVGEVDRSAGALFFLRTAPVDTSSDIPWVTGADWQKLHFTESEITSGTADWLADPDADGKTNLDEMAANTDPQKADRVQAFTTRVSPGNTLEMTVTKESNHVMDYRVEVSEDLIQWSDSVADIEVLIDSANQLVGRDRTPLDGIYRRFIRLIVDVE
jgi:hypothetical protein